MILHIEYFKWTNKKISISGKGRRHSEEAKAKMSIAKRGKPKSLEWRQQKAIDMGGKPFKVFLGSKKIGQWVIQKCCADFLGLSQGNISCCLTGKRRSAGGYIFEYA